MGRVAWAGPAEVSVLALAPSGEEYASVIGDPNAVRAWRYEPAEDPKWRHHWKHDMAGHVMVGGVPVGKCPSKMSLAQAEELLNAGVEWVPPRWREDYPQRIFVVHDGVVYRATPTNPGVSYHGFPEMIERLPPAPDLRRRILDMAISLGCGEEVDKWLRSKHTSVRPA